MKRFSWVMRIAFSLVAAIVAAGAITAAPAIASSQQPGNKLPRTCHTWRALFGPFFAVDAYTNKGLAWTTAGTEGSTIHLGNYKGQGKLDQCWKLQGGFGHGELEFALAHSGMCIRVHGGDKGAGAVMEAWPCLSYTSELFTAISKGHRAMWKNVKSGLCVTARVGITFGSTLVQERCSNFDKPQSWRLNASP